MVDFPPGIDFEARDKSWFGDGPLVAGAYGWKKNESRFLEGDSWVTLI